ncbi:MAG: cytochrome C [Desulfuromonadaceae bacterium]|nr:cytochrome C [Desulfuromonadaceae bacterium]MDD5105432.1 cytochrome C [Desulfuromonadaceae bacterium]
MKQFSKLVALICLMLCQPLPAAEVQQGAPAVNGSRDCSVCHAQEVKELTNNGKKHKNSQGCVFCHKGHPPEDRNVIPACSQCHNGTSSHYDVPDCKKCHISAHAPKQVMFMSDCVKCHGDQASKIAQHASKHSKVACTACHLFRNDKPHGFIPECLMCHKPHAAWQTAADCRKCHQAHMPKIVTYNLNTPSKECAACHKKAYELLTASTFKHQKLVCAACHQAKHTFTPQCQTCHGQHHAAEVHGRNPACGTCHNTAHDLSYPTPDKGK